jgi:hypothetical protein
MGHCGLGSQFTGPESRWPWKIGPQPDGACLRLGDAREQQGANSEGMARCAHDTPAG